jgi:hypothetical protein
MRDAHGHEVPFTPDHRSKPPFELKQRSKPYRLLPGAILEEEIAASTWLKPSIPGIYQLSVVVRLPYRSALGFGQEDGFIESSHSLPISVSLANPVTITQTARALKQEALMKGPMIGPYVAMKALVSMPPEIAAPIWLELGLAPDFHLRDELATLLRDFVATPTSKAIAAEIRIKKRQPESIPP